MKLGMMVPYSVRKNPRWGTRLNFRFRWLFWLLFVAAITKNPLTVNNLNNYDARDINLVSRPRFSGVIYSEMWSKLTFQLPMTAKLTPGGQMPKF